MKFKRKKLMYSILLVALLTLLGILLLINVGGFNTKHRKDIGIQVESIPDKESVIGKASEVQDSLSEYSLGYQEEQENMPEILAGDSILEVKINNQESYEAFIKGMNEYKKYSYLQIDLLGSSTILYLDEILSQNNFVFLEIKNGGVLSVKDMGVLRETNLQTLQLKFMLRVDNCVLNLFHSIETVLLWTDQSFDKQEFELFQSEEWKRLMSISAEDKRDYGAVYVRNEEGISYSSYELYSGTAIENPYVVISIRENKSESVILEMTDAVTGRIHISKDDGCRIRLEDVNFDGYKDILYLGDNNGLDLHHQCIGFLWNEKTGMYELCESLPMHFGFIDPKRKRLTYYEHDSRIEIYYIYEYDNDLRLFTEKRLEVEFRNETSVYGEGIRNWEKGDRNSNYIIAYICACIV